MVSDTLVRCRPEEQPFKESSLPKQLQVTFQKSDETGRIQLLTPIYAVLSRFNVDELVQLNKKYLNLLFGKKVEARKPAFLCCVSSGQYIQNYDYSLLIPIAAFFVHSSNDIVAKQSLNLLQNHLIDNSNVDIEKTLEVFLENYKKRTPTNEKAAQTILMQIKDDESKQRIHADLEKIKAIFQ